MLAVNVTRPFIRLSSLLRGFQSDQIGREPCVIGDRISLRGIDERQVCLVARRISGPFNNPLSILAHQRAPFIYSGDDDDIPVDTHKPIVMGCEGPGLIRNGVAILNGPQARKIDLVARRLPSGAGRNDADRGKHQ